MRWVFGESQIADELTARVWASAEFGPWAAEVRTSPDRELVWRCGGLMSKDAAVTAICHWMGKKIAQFGNSLAAGEPVVDEE